MTQLSAAIQALAGNLNNDSVQLFFAEVVSVDEDNLTCQVIPTSYQTDAQMTAYITVEGNEGFSLFPSVGSPVLVMFNKLTKPVIVMCSYVDKIFINGDSNGALVTINELVDRLNIVEKRCNDITQVINTLVLPVSGSSAGPPSPVPFTDTLIETQVSDIASTTIFQG